MALQIRNQSRNGGIGTAAAIVCFADKPDEPYLLSASHVLAATPDAAVSDTIVAATATPTIAVGTVLGTLTDWTGLIDGAGFPNLADVAIARLSNGLVPEVAFPDLAVLRFASGRPGIGALLSSLSPSGVTGDVSASYGSTQIVWNDTAGNTWDYGMASQIIGAFGFTAGDSGSAVVDDTGAIVGTVCGNSVDPTNPNNVSAVISPIDAIANHPEWGGRKLIAYAARGTLPVPLTPADFIAAHRADVLAMKAKYNIPASVCMAQSALETGWGQHVIGNSFFGIKAGNASGPMVQYATHEVVNGSSVPSMGTFRAYADFAESADDYGRLLTTAAPYNAALAVRTQPEAFASAIAAAGYATATNYGDLVISVMRSRNLLALDG